MRFLHLYRPRLPGLRAQAIQVLHTCHALAALGHRVTLLADRGPDPADAARVLEGFGLDAPDGLDLQVCPHRHKGLAGLWFRRRLARWWAGPPGVVLARDKRRLDRALRRHGPRHRVLLETHELDSALAAEAGRDPAEVRAIVALEARLARAADALVANCGGTLAAWEAAHDDLPAVRAVVHNGTAPSRLRRHPHPAPDPVLRCLGSRVDYKGLDVLAAAAPRLPLPVEVVGPGDRPLPGLRVRSPVPYPAVPDLLARSRVLVLPLADNLFGRHLTSPLKLWDYLATPVAVVAPDLPAVREIAALADARLHLHRPGDPADLARAVHEALAAPPREPFLRTWADRARQLVDVARRAGAAP